VKTPLAIAAIALVMASCYSATEGTMSPIKVEIIRSDSGYQLMRGGEPYVIKGAGMGVDDIRRFAAHGGNSIRNWTTSSEYQDPQSLLDSAHEHGVTVALGLPMRAERHGFDYDDSDAVAKQLEAFREDVIKYRDHPALRPPGTIGMDYRQRVESQLFQPGRLRCSQQCRRDDP
jgi:hypothetical protein